MSEPDRTPHEESLYDGRELVGTIRHLATGSEAIAPDGESLGQFYNYLADKGLV